VLNHSYSASLLIIIFNADNVHQSFVVQPGDDSMKFFNDNDIKLQEKVNIAVVCVAH